MKICLKMSLCLALCAPLGHSTLKLHSGNGGVSPHLLRPHFVRDLAQSVQNIRLANLDMSFHKEELDGKMSGAKRDQLNKNIEILGRYVQENVDHAKNVIQTVQLEDRQLLKELVRSQLKIDALSGKIMAVSGLMFSGKSNKLAQYAYQLREFGTPYVLTIPQCVAKEGAGVSRTGLRVEGKRWIVGPDDSTITFALKNEGVRNILIDEMHFLNRRQNLELAALSMGGYRIFATGLTSDFRGNPFPTLGSFGDRDGHLLCRVCGQDWAQLHVNLTNSTGESSLNPGQEKFTIACLPCWFKHVYGDKGTNSYCDDLFKEIGCRDGLGASSVGAQLSVGGEKNGYKPL